MTKKLLALYGLKGVAIGRSDRIEALLPNPHDERVIAHAMQCQQALDAGNMAVALVQQRKRFSAPIL
jgi:hypothetical protein